MQASLRRNDGEADSGFRRATTGIVPFHPGLGQATEEGDDRVSQATLMQSKLS